MNGALREAQGKEESVKGVRGRSPLSASERSEPNSAYARPVVLRVEDDIGRRRDAASPW